MSACKPAHLLGIWAIEGRDVRVVVAEGRREMSLHRKSGNLTFCIADCDAANGGFDWLILSEDDWQVEPISA